MTSRLTADHRARLEALRKAYAGDLPGRVRAVEEALAAFPDRDALEAAYHLVHRLNGSAAIHGFEAMHQAAWELDRLLASALEEDAGAGWKEELAVHLDALRRALSPGASPGEPR